MSLRNKIAQDAAQPIFCKNPNFASQSQIRCRWRTNSSQTLRHIDIAYVERYLACASSNEYLPEERSWIRSMKYWPFWREKNRSWHRRGPGLPDVMIQKKLFAKKFGKKFEFFTQNKPKLCKILIITLVFEKNANFFAENRRKLLS
jgi:hypothetical protein